MILALGQKTAKPLTFEQRLPDGQLARIQTWPSTIKATREIPI